jgi:proteasome lid subunit RPN8/RPN11
VKPSYLSIHAGVIRQLQEYCQRLFPLEGVGILAGREGVITHFFPIPTQSDCPCSLEFEPGAYLDAIKQMRALQLDWLGIFHSHPHTQAYPSSRDRTGWHLPDKSFWILSLKDAEFRLCAYYIQNESVCPVIYEIIGN